MEKSKNYNFNLPNSANDEIADINDISDNFRIIDEIMNETDQTFEPTSTKAASGKAVNEAISGIQPIDENTEFVFDGGDVDGGVSVDIVVDTVLSKTSNNPIANKAVATKFSEIIRTIYPVGAIFISTDSTSPATLFGGTWEQIKDTFLLAAGTTYAAGATGGEATHTLTIDEMPSHNHYVFATDVHTTTQSQSKDVYSYKEYSTTYNPIYSDFSGGGQPHNNMPPYLAVYVWKRTA